MGKPAARIGDSCAHGGAIVVGCPTVLIGGVPAARVGDMHVCPMLNPGTPPPPHVGGPISMGSPTVLIGGIPAARMGDMATCAGPPDSIILGCPTVLIGEAGAGAGSGGGPVVGAAPASAAAKASALAAMFDNVEASTKKEHWIEFQFVDKAGLPISGVPYKFTDPENKETRGGLRLDGTIHRDAMKEGNCKVQLYSISNAKWSAEKAEVGEKVKLSAEVEGFENGTAAEFLIYIKDIKGADRPVETIKAEVKGEKVEAEWEYVYEEENEEETGGEEHDTYSAPSYYFEVIVENILARSGLLDYKDWIEIELKDEEDNPIADEEYIVYLSNGEVRKGKLDGNGYKKEEKVPPGNSQVKFPNLTEIVNNDRK